MSNRLGPDRQAHRKIPGRGSSAGAASTAPKAFKESGDAGQARHQRRAILPALGQAVGAFDARDDERRRVVDIDRRIDKAALLPASKSRCDAPLPSAAERRHPLMEPPLPPPPPPPAGVPPAAL